MIHFMFCSPRALSSLCDVTQLPWVKPVELNQFPASREPVEQVKMHQEDEVEREIGVVNNNPTAYAFEPVRRGRVIIRHVEPRPEEDMEVEHAVRRGLGIQTGAPVVTVFPC